MGAVATKGTQPVPVRNFAVAEDGWPGSSEKNARLPPRRPVSNQVSSCCESGENLDAGERAFAAPLVVFAQLGLVFFNLSFQVAERFFAAGSHG